MNGLERKLLSQEARKIGLILGPTQIAQFTIYLDELKAWNKRIKLTSLTKDVDILIKHFIDSLLPWQHIPPEAHLLDIGSGAGFPGIPLKIAMPSLTVTLLDSRLKAIFFQRHIIRMLNLQGIETVHGRAEQMRRNDAFPFYDVVTSRALYTLEELQQVSSALLTGGGLLISFKTPLTVKDAEKRVKVGFRITESLDYVLPFRKGNRRIVFLQRA